MDINLIQQLGGKIYGDLTNIKVNGFENMYQQIKENTVFIAVKGVKFDGASFINQAIQNGAVAVIISKYYKHITIPQIIVDDVISFVIRYGTKKRKNFKNPVLAVLGSVGKTTLKNTLVSILPGNKLFTRKSYNIKFSIAMTLMSLSTQDFAIIEVGTNHRDEIDDIGRMLQPDYSFINTIGLEHSEFLGDMNSILKEEYSILKYTKILSLSTFQNFQILKENNKIPLEKHLFLPEFQIKIIKESLQSLVTCDFSETFDFNETFGFNKTYDLNKKQISFFVNSLDFGLIQSIVFALYLSHLLKLEINLEKTQNIYNVSHRQNKISLKTYSIFDSSYNANPVSMNNLLNTIDILGEPCTLFFGSMEELGSFSESEHQKILEKIYHNSFIEKCYIIKYNNISTIYKNKIEFFEINSLENTENLKSISTKYIFIQGSRSNSMEKIVFYLINESFKTESCKT